jgi:predicted histidine transporter YuiF (NhaC family)
LPNGASIALSYALVGGFANAVAHSGIVEWILAHLQKRIDRPDVPPRRARTVIILLLIATGMLCKSILPLHIAFIPILIPPLLPLMNRLQMDRRMIACILAFGLAASYMIIPLGFGHIFLRGMLVESLLRNGIPIDMPLALRAMILPFLAMVLGMAIAIFGSYARPRRYKCSALANPSSPVNGQPRPLQIVTIFLSLMAILIVQMFAANNMSIGMVGGLLVLTIGGVVPLRKMDSVIADGFKTMALIGMIMVAAAGFTEVLRQTGGIENLVSMMLDGVNGSRPLAVLLALLIGLLITLGIGSAFATTPIVAALFVPLGNSLGLNTFGITTLVAVAALLGDPGSPVSSTTLGPSAGLAVDGQFDHISESVLPTFVHFNLPLLLIGWLTILLC